tara:strand:+ start:661 stop:1749 length:1089 start_codon:yes stop_codon:yes gene_type:complete
MKPKFLYLNYHSNPEFKSYSDKLNRFNGAFAFLNYLKDEHQVMVIDHIGENEKFEKDGVLYLAKKKKANNKWLIPFKLHFEIIQLRPDIIYLQSLTQMHLLIFLVPFLSKNTKILVQHHAEQPPKLIKRWILSFADQFVDSYFFTSEAIAEEWINKKVISSKNKITEIVEGSTFFKLNHQVIRNPNSYLWVARLNNNKNPLMVITTFIEFLEKEPTAKLTMVYSSFELLKELKQIINQHPLAKNNIKLLGKVPHEKLEKIYQQHDFFILASYYEGGSFSLIESMACGCIPIVSYIPANLYMTNDGDCGFLFNPNNKDELLRCLKTSQVINKEHYRENVSIVFNQKLTFQAIARKMKKTIENL